MTQTAWKFFLLLVVCSKRPCSVSSNYCTGEAPRHLQRLISTTTTDTSTVTVYDEFYELSAPVLNFLVDYNQSSLTYERQTFPNYLVGHMARLMENGTLPDYYKHLSFLLICGKDCIQDIMKQVTDLDNTMGQGSLLRHFSTWLIITHASPAQLQLNITLDHVSLISVSHLHVVAASFKELETLKEGLFNELQQTRSCLEYGVYTLMWMPGGREWSFVHQLGVTHDVLYTTVFPNRLRGLNGRKIHLVTLEWPPWTIRKETERGVTYTGSGIDGIELLSRKFNFSYITVEPRDERWGQEQENGSWTGLIGMIQGAEAEMCPVPFSMSMKRKRFMDFTSPMMSDEYRAMYRKRSHSTNSWLYLLSCFSWQVYVCGVVSLFWIVVLLACLHYTGKRDSVSEGNKIMLQCLELGFNVPLRQGISEIPQNISAKVVLFTWCIFCLIVTTVYTGNLVAMATAEKYDLPFTTLEELAEQDDYEIGVIEGTFGDTMLKNSNDPVLKSIYTKIIKSRMKAGSGFENSLAGNVKRTIEDKYVLIGSDSEKEMIGSLTCDLVEMRERLSPVHRSYIFPRNSPLRDLFDKQVLVFANLGVFAKMRREWITRSMRCDSNKPATGVRLPDLKTAFVSCATGVMLAVVMLLCETWYKKQQQMLSDGRVKET